MEPSERLMPALRRYVKYNNSDELINGFDYKLTIDIVYEMQAEIDALREALKFTHTELDKHHLYYSTLPMFNKYGLLAHKQEKE